MQARLAAFLVPVRCSPAWLKAAWAPACKLGTSRASTQVRHPWGIALFNRVVCRQAHRLPEVVSILASQLRVRLCPAQAPSIISGQHRLLPTARHRTRCRDSLAVRGFTKVLARLGAGEWPCRRFPDFQGAVRSTAAVLADSTAVAVVFQWAASMAVAFQWAAGEEASMAVAFQ